MLRHVKEARVIHSGENLSNHSAIYVKISIGETDIKCETPRRTKVVSWAKATDDAKENFRNVLEDQLSNINKPECIECTDLDCSEHAHKSDKESYTINIFESIEKSCHLCFPFNSSSTNGRSRKGILPG